MRRGAALYVAEGGGAAASWLAATGFVLVRHLVAAAPLDFRGSAAYRAEMAAVLTRRVLAAL